jgi:hypothetical protein
MWISFGHIHFTLFVGLLLVVPSPEWVSMRERKMEEPRTQITVPSIDQWFISLDCEGTCESSDLWKIINTTSRPRESSRLSFVLFYLSFSIRLRQSDPFPFNLSIYFSLTVNDSLPWPNWVLMISFFISWTSLASMDIWSDSFLPRYIYISLSPFQLIYIYILLLSMTVLLDPTGSHIYILSTRRRSPWFNFAGIRGYMILPLTINIWLLHNCFRDAIDSLMKVCRLPLS